MSYCKCGGYLGSGGVDGYAGRWCQCANPVMDDTQTVSSGQVTLTCTCSGCKELEAENKALREEVERLEEIEWMYNDLCK
ncbi:unnamed protein product [marine sediment metagenome]|uniref:Uncharacterized protein n=1 Tax=marine sediment metagenome TaxID=412755 RepID=X0W954_9ZZZZ